MNAQQLATTPATAGTGNTDLVLISSALIEIDKVGAGLEAMRQLYAGVIYDVATTEGMEAAKRARQAVRQPRYDIERIRTNGKAPILSLGRKLDAEAARITAECMKVETPIDQQIKAEEERIEAEKRAKAAVELARVQEIRADIDEIRTAPLGSVGRSAEAIAERIREIETDQITEVRFGEFTREAGEVRQAALAQLRRIHEERVAAEAETARLKAEREELNRQRVEQARIDRHQRALADIRTAPAMASTSSEAYVIQRRDAILAVNCASFEEYADEASALKATVVDLLNSLLADRARQAREAEEQRARAQVTATALVAEQARAAELQRQLDEANAREQERQQREALAAMPPAIATVQAEADQATPVAAAADAESAAVAVAGRAWPASAAVDFDTPSVPDQMDLLDALIETFDEDRATVLGWLRSIDWQQINLE